MASTIRTIADRVRTVLRAIDGTGSYTYDLSDDVDRVNYRDGFPAFDLPAINITALNLDNDESPVLTKYARTLTVRLVAYAGSSTDAPGDYLLAAADLANDIHIALETDRTAGTAGSLGVLGHSVVVSSDALDGATIQIDGCGIVFVEVAVQYRATLGA